MKSATRHRVLIVAEAANPEWTSVPLIGWSLSRALAKITEAHIVTHVRNREAFKRAGLIEERDFTAIDNEYLAGPVWKLANTLRGGQGVGWTTLTAFSSLSYYSFENAVWRLFSSRIKKREFDLVHRVTPLSPTHQSLIASRLNKLNIPFVIGPLNGGIPWPRAFNDRRHAEREWLSYFRGLFRLMPAYRSTRKHAAVIIAGSKYTLSEMPPSVQAKCVYIPENGVDVDRFSLVRTRSASLPLRGVFVGRLVPYKGADILLEAAADFIRSGVLELQFVGDGPQRAALENIANQRGIRSKVIFHGWLQHTDVQRVLSESDFMALPSIREFGGGAVIKSMALGVTPIVADYGGPSELVDETTGIRVKFSDKETLVTGLTQAITDVVRSPGTLDRFGAAAHKKVLPH